MALAVSAALEAFCLLFQFGFFLPNPPSKLAISVFFGFSSILPPPWLFFSLPAATSNLNPHLCYFCFLLELYQTMTYIYIQSIHPPHRIVVRTLTSHMYTNQPTPIPSIQFDHPCMYSYIFSFPPVHIYISCYSPPSPI